MIEWIKRSLGMVLVPSIDHLTTYRAKVVGQSSDKLKVDLQVDDARIGTLSKVPILLGLPGCTVDIAAGCYVRLGWRGGDPRQPYATSWEAGATVNRLDLNGSDYSALQTETLLADLKTWATAANAVLGGNCVNGSTISTYAAQATALAAFVTALGVAGAYKSTKVKNG